MWAALTDENVLPEWLAAARIDLAVDGEVMLQWLIADGEDDESVVRGVVTALDPPWLLEYLTDVHGLLRWELRADADGTALTFVNHSPMSSDHLLHTLAGWHTHLDHLEDALAGHPVDWSSWSSRTRSVASGLSQDDHRRRYSDRRRP